MIILTSRRFVVSSNRDTESCLAGQSAAFIGVFTGSVTNTFGERLPLTFSIVRLSDGAELLAELVTGDSGVLNTPDQQRCSYNICNFNK